MDGYLGIVGIGEKIVPEVAKSLIAKLSEIVMSEASSGLAMTYSAISLSLEEKEGMAALILNKTELLWTGMAHSNDSREIARWGRACRRWPKGVFPVLVPTGDLK